MADQKVPLPIEGMSCEHCAQRVKNALEGVSGVVRADVDLEAEQATVTLRNGTSRDALAQAVDEAGYSVPAEA